MNLSIRPVTPEMMRQFGAQAFDAGLTIDDHNMNPWVPAVADWKQGWRDRRAEVQAKLLLVAAMEVSPP